MKDPQVISAALGLRYAIESQSNGEQIQWQTLCLAQALGGYADVSRMEPGQAALYLVALRLSQLEDE